MIAASAFVLSETSRAALSSVAFTSFRSRPSGITIFADTRLAAGMLESSGAPTNVYEEPWLEHADNIAISIAAKNTFTRNSKYLLMFMPRKLSHL
jgi:hypothetical protein